MFKTKIISNKTEKILKEKQKCSLQVSKNISTVGILVNEKSVFDFEMLKDLQRQIAAGSKNFFVMTCKESNESYNEFRGVIFNEKEVSWNGKLQSSEVVDFLNNPFDMLIDYTQANSLSKKYLVAKSKAKFKVGFANIDDRLYDLMFSVTENDIESFNKELIKYLIILNKL
jgi:iron uptake system EfeUOB component EfeO/EfeM